MKKIFLFSTGFLCVLLLFSCIDLQDHNKDNNEDLLDIENAIIPNDFNYSTQSGVTVRLNVPDNYKNAIVSLCTYQPNADSLCFARVAFDDAGFFEANYSIPSYIDTIMVVSDYLGLIKEIKIGINNGVAAFDYRPLYEEYHSTSAYIFPEQLKSASADGYTFIGNFDGNGVPEYLVERDIIQQNLIDDINASLPERQKLPEVHPEYLDAGKNSNLELSKKADVWVTFVTEGAGWRNALGYYTYELGKKPKTTDEIEKLYIIFPNASQNGHGGGLIPGDKVYLGTFEANTGIGWFLLADGWRNGIVRIKNGIHFSDSEFNAESTADLRRHVVMLYDESRELFLLGFEDVPRNWDMCDDDFNDAVFYATANPVSAVIMNNVNKITAANDSDGDGINDELDDFPFDPDRTFNNFSPSKQSNGTLAYEDLWPSIGDYDFNDCVIDYHFNLIANAHNEVKTIEATFTIDHIGAAYQNGFAFEMPIAENRIKSVDGSVLNEGYIELNSNGTESGLSNAVIVVAENASSMEGETVKITIDLKSATNKDDLGIVPFNPFIIVNGNRTREVHLADMAPTAKGMLYLGNNDDYSDISKGRYYKTKRNLPWGLNIYEDFKVSQERISIDKTYPRFVQWANSGGTLEKDWYK